jgi:hypothetical protein
MLTSWAVITDYGLLIRDAIKFGAKVESHNFISTATVLTYLLHGAESFLRS